MTAYLAAMVLGLTASSKTGRVESSLCISGTVETTNEFAQTEHVLGDVVALAVKATTFGVTADIEQLAYAGDAVHFDATGERLVAVRSGRDLQPVAYAGR